MLYSLINLVKSIIKCKSAQVQGPCLHRHCRHNSHFLQGSMVSSFVQVQVVQFIYIFSLNHWI